MKLRLSISPATCILLFCMIATTPLQSLTACLSAAAIHELGHIAAAKLLSINLSELRIDVLGARLGTCGRLCSYPALITLCLAGPAINFLCFVIALPFCNRVEWLHEFGLSSLSLGLMNLIPVEGFDGGRILHALLSLALPVSAVEKIGSILGFFSLLCIWLLSVWLLLRTGTSLTLFVFSCCLFAMLFV
jgi:Zn-dependent protease